jgi:hypothetical protein
MAETSIHEDSKCGRRTVIHNNEGSDESSSDDEDNDNDNDRREWQRRAPGTDGASM